MASLFQRPRCSTSRATTPSVHRRRGEHVRVCRHGADVGRRRSLARAAPTTCDLRRTRPVLPALARRERVCTARQHGARPCCCCCCCCCPAAAPANAPDLTSAADAGRPRRRRPPPRSRNAVRLRMDTCHRAVVRPDQGQGAFVLAGLLHPKSSGARRSLKVLEHEWFSGSTVQRFNVLPESGTF